MATLNDTSVATVECMGKTIREINRELRERIENGARNLRLANPAGRHNLAVALLRPATIEVDGSAGYFLGGMMDGPRILVRGNCGWSAGETMLSGEIVVEGHAGNSVAASMRGGTVVVRGDAGARAGIAMKGGLLLIGGSAGYMSGFMMQRGTMVVRGDAGPAIGDSLYEGRIFVAGKLASPGTDAVVCEADAEDQRFLREALSRYKMPWPGAFKKIESGRRLWNFSKKEIGVWIEAL
jgi:glutamate synthase domain-containing protein 3